MLNLILCLVMLEQVNTPPQAKPFLEVVDRAASSAERLVRLNAIRWGIYKPKMLPPIMLQPPPQQWQAIPIPIYVPPAD